MINIILGISMIELSKHESIVKYGDILSIYHLHGLSDCRAVPLMLRMYADTIEDGHNGDYSTYFNNEHDIIWAEYNGKPVGGLYYIVREGKEIAWLTYVFVDYNMRRRGILQYCFKELTNLLILQNIKELHGLVHVNNIGSIAFCKRVGFAFFPSKFNWIND